VVSTLVFSLFFPLFIDFFLFNLILRCYVSWDLGLIISFNLFFMWFLSISRKCPNIELLLDFTRKNMNLLFWERMKKKRSKLKRRPFLIYKNVLVPFGLFFCLGILSKKSFLFRLGFQLNSLVQSFIFLTFSSQV